MVTDYLGQPLSPGDRVVSIVSKNGGSILRNFTLVSIKLERGIYVILGKAYAPSERRFIETLLNKDKIIKIDEIYENLPELSI